MKIRIANRGAHAALLILLLTGCNAPKVEPTQKPASSAAAATTEATALQEARNALQQGRNADALTLYKSLIQQNERNAAAQEGLGLALLETGDTAPAIVHLTRALRLDPSRSAAQAALAQIAYAQGLLAEARLRLQAVLKAQPENAAFWHTLGLVIRDEQGDAAAQEPFANAVKFAPQEAVYRMDYGDALLEAKQTTEAEKQYREAFRLAPEAQDVKSRFGAFLVQKPGDASRWIEAKPLLQAALAMQRDDAYAQFHLARILLEEGDAQRAIALMEPILAGPPSPEMREVWYVLSRAYARSNRPGDAARAVATARRLTLEHDTFMNAQEKAARNPNDAQALLGLARLFVRRQEYAKALAEYGSVLRRDPQNRPARSELDALQKRLKAEGKMPDMTLFNAVLAANSAESAPR